ncbi:MAG TPA: CFI-box-CTERM domain-containing protein [Polyangiales bacterium]|nr:CFI-box-CTERM domain-containing protein [Polyangiales bacterium]
MQRKQRGCAVVLALACALSVARAEADGSAVLEFRYTPVARAQVAIWIEDVSGKFLATVALTEAVAFRGIGNRPGASLMNSGYRWPYGRREGVLPIWGHRRAAAPGAKQFPRVIFQSREEGFASQTISDQSKDTYFCLQFDVKKSSKQELVDAISCATQFNSDKGRYMTQADVDKGYTEPWEVRDASGTRTGMRRKMPLYSVYPARMDAMRCSVSSSCFDHADVERFASDVRRIMPEIDAVTRATPPGDTPQRVLFTVPSSWPKGDYVAWLEVNVEGDYNDEAGTTEARMMGWNDTSYPTPLSPDGAWDYYSMNYGYAYRGQPSLAYKVPFKLGGAGEQVSYADDPAGRSSWDHWSEDYGKLEPVTFSAATARHMSDQNGSGADRLRRDAQGHRLSVVARVSGELVDPVEPDPEADAGSDSPVTPGMDAGMPVQPTDAGTQQPSGPSAQTPPPVKGQDGVVLRGSDDAKGTVGSIEGLSLRPHGNRLRTHEWIVLRFQAARSDAPLHEYEVRVATEPIVDEQSFIRVGRPAKNATDDAEGATALVLPVDVAPGKWIEAAVGDLTAETQYYVAVRATDENNRHGPISVAEITTTERRFATVTPCFVATAAYGTPLAAEISVLRQLRDRQLLATAPGRVLVAAYQELGPPAARFIAQHDGLRSLVRGLLAPILALARWLP